MRHPSNRALGILWCRYLPNRKKILQKLVRYSQLTSWYEEIYSLRLYRHWKRIFKYINQTITLFIITWGCDLWPMMLSLMHGVGQRATNTTWRPCLQARKFVPVGGVGMSGAAVSRGQKVQVSPSRIGTWSSYSHQGGSIHFSVVFQQTNLLLLINKKQALYTASNNSKKLRTKVHEPLARLHHTNNEKLDNKRNKLTDKLYAHMDSINTHVSGWKKIVSA